MSQVYLKRKLKVNDKVYYPLKDVLILDIETAKKDLNAGISAENSTCRIWGAYSYNTNKITYGRSAIGLQKLINSHKIVVGHNIKGFDIPVLKADFNINFWDILVLDTLEILRKPPSKAEKEACKKKGIKPRYGKGRSLIIGEARKIGMIDNTFPDFKLSTIAKHGFKLFGEHPIYGKYFTEYKDEDFDYDKLNGEISEETWLEIEEYLKLDLIVTKNIFEFLEVYFESFAIDLKKEDILNLEYVHAPTGKYGYKCLTYDLNLPEKYGNGSKGKFPGAFVFLPTQEKYTPKDGNGYCIDLNSLHPHSIYSGGLANPVENCRHKINGVCPNPYSGDGKIFKLNGVYCGCEIGKIEKFIRYKYFLRLKQKRKFVKNNGVEIKYKNCKINDEIIYVDDNRNIKLKKLTEKDVKKAKKLSDLGVDPREYSTKILINCFIRGHNILTNRGFIPIEYVRKTDLIYSLDKNNNPILLPIKQKIRGITTSTYKIKSIFIDVECTGNHKWYYNDKGIIKTIKTKDIKKPIQLIKPVIQDDNKQIVDGDIYLSDYIIPKEIRFKLKNNNKFIKRDLKNLFPSIRYYQYNKFYSIKENNLTTKKIKYIENKYNVICDGRLKNKNNFIQLRQDKNNFFKFLGYFISEGSIYKSKIKKYKTTIRGITNKINISQYKIVNPIQHKEIITIISNIIPKYSIRDKGISFSSDILYEFLRSFYKDKKKIIPWEIYDLLSLSEKELILKYMYKGDGNQNGQWRYNTNSNILANQVAMVLFEKGYIPKITFDTKCFRITRKHKHIIIRPEYITKKINKKEVFCVDIGDNPILIERNGYSVITSNSIYGVLSSPIFESTYNKTTGADCTLMSVQVIKFMSKLMIDAGYILSAGDTDSLYLMDPFKDKNRLLSYVENGMKQVRKAMPFSDMTYNMGIDAEFTHIFFFKDEKDKAGKFKKKNYIYITNDGKIKIQGLPIIKSNSPKLAKLIYTKYLEKEIKETRNIKFEKDYLQQLIHFEINKDINILAVKVRVKPASSYATASQLQAQISKHYFNGKAGNFIGIKHLCEGLGVGKGKHYCSLVEAKGLNSSNLDLTTVWKVLDPFIRKDKQTNIFEF